MDMEDFGREAEPGEGGEEEGEEESREMEDTSEEEVPDDADFCYEKHTGDWRTSLPISAHPLARP